MLAYTPLQIPMQTYQSTTETNAKTRANVHLPVPHRD